MNKIKFHKLKKTSTFRYFLVWFSPFFLFLMALFVMSALSDESFEKYIRLLDVLVWPCAVLMIFFFFRKILMYFVFAIEKKLNIFDIGDEFDSIPHMVREKAEELYMMQNLKKEMDEKECHVEKKIEDLRNKENASPIEWLDITEEILEYSKKLGAQYLETVQEKKKLTEQVSTLFAQVEDLKKGTIQAKK
jgi:hypothetical protein